MDADKLEALLAEAVKQYTEASPADRPAIAEAAAGAMDALFRRSMARPVMRECGTSPCSSLSSARAQREGARQEDAPGEHPRGHKPVKALTVRAEELRNEEEQESLVSGHRAEPRSVRCSRSLEDVQSTQSGPVECGGERRQTAVPEESGDRDPRPYAGERTTTTGQAGRSLT